MYGHFIVSKKWSIFVNWKFQKWFDLIILIFNIIIRQYITIQILLTNLGCGKQPSIFITNHTLLHFGVHNEVVGVYYFSNINHYIG
jgi:hypothetical protein